MSSIAVEQSKLFIIFKTCKPQYCTFLYTCSTNFCPGNIRFIGSQHIEILVLYVMLLVYFKYLVFSLQFCES